MLRILSGTLKGRRLKTVKETHLRPTGVRVRKAIFDILDQSQRDYTRVLDLYAGVGTLGIEALSRRAKECVFVEQSSVIAQCLKDNILKCALQERALILTGDVFRQLPLLKDRRCEAFDIVFLDPPYRSYSADVLPLLIDLSLVDQNTFFVVEHHQRVSVDCPEGWRCVIKKTYGQTVVSFLEHTL